VTVPVLSLACFVVAGVFAVIFLRGLVTGRASTRYIRNVARADNPAAYWTAQAFNGLFAVACVFAGVVAITGI
jgi:hypothetical protein